ncbi:hypothetical protein [Olsenella uli]
MTMTSAIHRASSPATAARRCLTSASGQRSQAVTPQSENATRAMRM